MAGYVGLNECAEYDIAGAGSYVAFDKVESGSMGHDGGAMEWNIGVGGQVAGYRGMVVPIGSIKTMLQSINLLNCVLPASLGALPTVVKKIHGGPLVDAVARLHGDAYINRLVISCEREAPVMVEYGWMALAETNPHTIASAATKQTNTPVVWHDGAVEFNGAGYKCQSWSVEILNEITAQISGDEKVAGSERLPEWFDPGNVTMKLSARIRVPLGLDFTDAIITPLTFDFTGKDRETVQKTFHLDGTGGDGWNLDSDPIPIVSGTDAVIYEVSASSMNDLDLVSFTFAA